MRLHRRIGPGLWAGVFVLALGACAGSAPVAPPSAARSMANDPSADYPVVIGDPFTIDGVVYTPEDTMNYDQVGYLGVDDAGAAGVTGAHRTLPLPSYAEVTSLDSGRTILVRIERRGPMTGDRLIALADGALRQLGADAGTPVRVRRVNPPEEHRAELRAGREAPLRMATPPGLLEVLKRRLPARGSAELGDPRQARISGTVPSDQAIATVDPGASRAAPTAEFAVERPVESPQPVATAASELRTAPEPAAAGSASASSNEGGFAVQIGAFSVHANAERLAKELDGFVTTSGPFALVRVGPYASRGQAEQALAKLRAQGYSGAQIRTLD